MFGEANFVVDVFANISHSPILRATVPRFNFYSCFRFVIFYINKKNKQTNKRTFPTYLHYQYKKWWHPIYMECHMLHHLIFLQFRNQLLILYHSKTKPCYMHINWNINKIIEPKPNIDCMFWALSNQNILCLSIPRVRFWSLKQARGFIGDWPMNILFKFVCFC